jgi:hypothetical protein
MATGAMASSRDIDTASTYDERMKQKPIGETHAVDDIYIQYAKDTERIDDQRRATLEVLKYYRNTSLVPTNRRLIPNAKDLKMLIEALGLEDID